MDSEFTGKSFREALEIIFYDPKDAKYTTRQIDTAEKLHEALLASEKQASYREGQRDFEKQLRQFPSTWAEDECDLFASHVDGVVLSRLRSEQGEETAEPPAHWHKKICNCSIGKSHVREPENNA